MWSWDLILGSADQRRMIGSAGGDGLRLFHQILYRPPSRPIERENWIFHSSAITLIDRLHSSDAAGNEEDDEDNDEEEEDNDEEVEDNDEEKEEEDK